MIPLRRKFAQYRGKTVRLFFGRAGNGVARLALQFGHQTVNVPLTAGWFLAEFPEQPDRFLSYRADGRVFENRAFPRWTRPARVARPPHQVTRARELARIRVAGSTEQVTLFIARASNGGYCQIVRSTRRSSNRGCGLTPPTAREIAVGAMSFGGAPGGILLLVGPVGSRVATLELRYQNGRAAPVSPHRGWALYEVKRPDYHKGRRPEVLIGRDDSGRTITSKRLPWATTKG